MVIVKVTLGNETRLIRVGPKPELIDLFEKCLSVHELPKAPPTAKIVLRCLDADNDVVSIVDGKQLDILMQTLPEGRQLRVLLDDKAVTAVASGMSNTPDGTPKRLGDRDFAFDAHDKDSFAKTMAQLPPTARQLFRDRSAGAKKKETDIIQVLHDIHEYICAQDDGSNAAISARVRRERTLLTPNTIGAAAAAAATTASTALSTEAIPTVDAEGQEVTAGLDLTTVRSWNVSQVLNWLSATELTEHSETFETNDISGDVLLDLDHDTLASMGISSAGKRLRVLRAIGSLKPFAL